MLIHKAICIASKSMENQLHQDNRIDQSPNQ